MLFHRAETFNHIVSTTSFGGVGNKGEEMSRMFISEAMELTRNLGHLDDSDRSSIYSTYSEFDSGKLYSSSNRHSITKGFTLLQRYLQIDIVF